MTRETVDRILHDYKTNIGRVGYLDARIVVLEGQLEEEENEEIESVFLHSPNMDGMPHGNAVSRPTEVMAERLSTSFVGGMTGAIKAEIAAYRKEASQLRGQIRYVQAWMSGLTEREKFILERKVFDEQPWRIQIEDFKAKYGVEYSKNGLKNIYRQALEKVYLIAN